MTVCGRQMALCIVLLAEEEKEAYAAGKNFRLAGCTGVAHAFLWNMLLYIHISVIIVGASIIL
jgi:hypothetical protein